MKKGVGLIIVILLSQVQLTNAGSENSISTLIVDLIITESDLDVSYHAFRFTIKVEIWNNYKDPVEVTDSDSCLFQLFVLAEFEDPQLESDMGYVHQLCFDPFTSETYDPGITTQNKSYDVTFENYTNPDYIPNGRYIFSFGYTFPNGWDMVTEVYPSYLTAIDGEYNFTVGGHPHNWGDHEDKPWYEIVWESRWIVPTFVVSVLTVLAYLIRKYTRST